MIFTRLLACSLAAASAHALTFQVAPSGELPSLTAARDAIRARKAQGALAEDVHVVIAEGTYALTEPVVFEPQDGGTAEHPISYGAAPGAHPLFTGGKKIAGFKAGADGVWTVQVDPAWKFEALWVNGERAIRARTPNAGYFEATGSPAAPLPDAPLNGALEQCAINVSPDDAASLAGLSAEELRDTNVIVYHSWQTSRHRLAGLDAARGTLQFTGPARSPFFQLEPYHRLQFENYRAALDAPGEWFLARGGTLFYIPRPGEKPETAEVIAPVAPQWLVMHGDAETDQRVEHLRFSGLRFAHQNYTLPEVGWSSGQADPELLAAIHLDGARDIVFADCEFAHTLTHAIRFGHGCTDSRIVHSHFHDLGGGGVYIGETAIPKDERGATGRITLDNCILQAGGRHFPGAIGVWIGHSADNAITHCDIGDWYYSAISIGWTWGYHASPCDGNRVEFCHLHHLGWSVLSDLGAVYTLGPQPRTAIRGCRVHDISCSSYGGWGLYNDEGSTGIVWENNLVYRTQSGGYHQHYGRENIIRNNIFAFAKEVQVRRSRPEDFLAFTFEKNIVVFDEGKLLGHLDANWRDGNYKLDHNLYWRTDGQPFDFAGKDFAAWQAAGNDAASLIADPLFADAKNGDFQLRENSPAAKIGFVPFDPAQAGVTGDQAWKRLAEARTYPPMTFGEKPAAPPLVLHDGFENTAPQGRVRFARVSDGGRKDSVQVVEENPSAGKRCLKITDGPDLQPAFNPHFYYVPGHHGGTTRVAFDVKVEPAIHWIHEWRNDAAPYRTGPMVMIENGKLSIPGRALLDVPANAWLHLEITAALGEKSTATWSLAVTLPGSEPQRFDGLKFVHPEMKTLDWLGFVSAGTEVASWWLDDLDIAHQAD